MQIYIRPTQISRNLIDTVVLRWYKSEITETAVKFAEHVLALYADGTFKHTITKHEVTKE